MASKSYNGHRSWNAWNVSLWLNNEEGSYNEMVRLVRKCGRAKAARIMARDYEGMRTPDGAKYNRTCIYEAMEGIE
jgi:hypothetical protein